nr:hypothetical protein [Bifidobacterium rousetti]
MAFVRLVDPYRRKLELLRNIKRSSLDKMFVRRQGGQRHAFVSRQQRRGSKSTTAAFGSSLGFRTGLLPDQQSGTGFAMGGIVCQTPAERQPVEETLKRLLPQKLKDQYAFRTQRAIDALTCIEVIRP